MPRAHGCAGAAKAAPTSIPTIWNIDRGMRVRAGADEREEKRAWKHAPAGEAAHGDRTRRPVASGRIARMRRHGWRRQAGDPDRSDEHRMCEERRQIPSSSPRTHFMHSERNICCYN